MNAPDVLAIHKNGFYRALIHRDHAYLAGLYADDYVLVRSDGSVLRKAEVLEDLTRGDLRFQSIDLLNHKIRTNGNVAILTGESRTVSSRSGVEASAHFRLVAIYEESHDTLRLTYFQSTSISL